jgi:hypothetical protein
MTTTAYGITLTAVSAGQHRRLPFARFLLVLCRHALVRHSQASPPPSLPHSRMAHSNVRVEDCSGALRAMRSASATNRAYVALAPPEARSVQESVVAGKLMTPAPRRESREAWGGSARPTFARQSL